MPRTSSSDDNGPPFLEAGEPSGSAKESPSPSLEDGQIANDAPSTIAPPVSPAPTVSPTLEIPEPNNTEPSPQGRRGIDYPAFDLLRHGLFGDEDNGVELTREAAASVTTAEPAAALSAASHPPPPLATMFAPPGPPLPSSTVSLLEDILQAFSQRIAAAEIVAESAAPQATGQTAAQAAMGTLPSDAAASMASLATPLTGGSLAAEPEPGTPTAASSAEGADAARRIIVTVNYIVGSTETPDTTEGRRGQLVLSVPDVPVSQNVQELITFATSVALRAFVTRVASKKPCCTTKDFQALKVLTRETLTTEARQPCPICYEEYVVSDVTEKAAAPADEGPSRKKRKVESQSAPLEEPPQELLSHSKQVYGHAPLQLDCHHVFGQSCIAEWLKDNTTCPLCRHKVVKGDESETDPTIPPIFVVLPNLLEYYRDVLSRRGGNPNLLVLNGNHQLTRDNTRRLTGLGYLIALRDDDGSVIRSHLGGMEGAEGVDSEARSRLFGWSEPPRGGSADESADSEVEAAPGGLRADADLGGRLSLPRVRQFFDRLLGDLTSGPLATEATERLSRVLFPTDATDRLARALASSGRTPIPAPTSAPTSTLTLIPTPRGFVMHHQGYRQPGGLHMLFPMGVTSRRAADGVHTFAFQGENVDLTDPSGIPAHSQPNSTSSDSIPRESTSQTSASRDSTTLSGTPSDGLLPSTSSEQTPESPEPSNT